MYLNGGFFVKFFIFINNFLYKTPKNHLEFKKLRYKIIDQQKQFVEKYTHFKIIFQISTFTYYIIYFQYIKCTGHKIEHDL